MTKALFPGIATLQWEKVCNWEKNKKEENVIICEKKNVERKKDLIKDLGSFILYNNHMLTISIDLHC